MRAILTAERLKRVKMLDLEPFADRLLADLRTEAAISGAQSPPSICAE